MGTIGTVPGDRLAGLLIDQLEKIRKGGLTLDELALFIQRKNPFEPKVVIKRVEFPVTIDYSKSLADMIKAGKYDWKNDDITAERFPIKGEGTIERTLSLIHFDRVITNDDAMHEIMAECLKEPATIEDLLAFGAKYPEEQRKYPIIALGSSAEVRGDRGVPCLRRRGTGRCLNLNWFGNGWGEGCRFLARNRS